MRKYILFLMLLGPHLVLGTMGALNGIDHDISIIVLYIFCWTIPWMACMISKINPGIFILWSAPVIGFWKNYEGDVPQWFAFVFVSSMALAGAVFLRKVCRITLDTPRIF